jgi:hypothetical protein
LLALAHIPASVAGRYLDEAALLARARWRWSPPAFFRNRSRAAAAKRGSLTEQFSGVGRKMLSEARTVAALAPELADRV